MFRDHQGKPCLTSGFSDIIVSMFEGVEVEDLLSKIDAHDFTADHDLEHGATRIDAIVAYERVIRAAQARQLAQVNALYEERVTGISHADSVDVEVGITISADALLGADDSPAELDGYGPIAPGMVDDLISRAHRVFYRRLITDPVDQTLIGRDPRRRRFDGPLNGFIRARDRHRCRQPGCDCGIGDIDHINDFANGGTTTSSNGQGLCRRSHTLKHQPGWTVSARGRDTIWRTPTGHTYTSPAPTVLAPRRM